MLALLILYAWLDMITALILLPLVGALVVGVARSNYARGDRSRHLTLLTAIVAIRLVAKLRHQRVPAFSWSNGMPGFPAIGAEYLVGIDGLSLLLVLLTSLIFPFALLAQRGSRGFCALMLLMQSALYGTFTAQNFVLWFLFYEMSLIPAFLLIKIWGGEKRDRAATKFFVYTFLGSVAMLLSFLGIYFAQRHVRFRRACRSRKNRIA